MMTISPDTQVETPEYRIPKENLPELEKRLAKLDRKAAKLGCRPAKLTILREETETDEDDPRLIHAYLVCTIACEPVRLNGWEFVATLQHINQDGIGNIIRNISGQTLPDRFRDVDSTNCDHCHTRRNRIDTFVVRNTATNSYAQVGRNCLADFIGTKNPDDLVRRAEMIGAYDETCRAFDGCSAGASYINTASYLEEVTAVISVYGWKSRTKAREDFSHDATADILRHMYSRCVRQNVCETHLKMRDAKPDPELAEKALEWGRSGLVEKAEKSPDNEYLYNLRIVTALDANEWRSDGLLASLIPAYQREMGHLAEKKAREAAEGVSKHYGELKRRYKGVNVSVISTFTSDGYYGPTHIHQIRIGNNHAVWFSTSELLDAGEYVMDFTVKDHTEYKGTKQTVLSRCKAK